MDPRGKLGLIWIKRSVIVLYLLGEIFGITHFECYVSAFYLKIHLINLRIYLKNPL